MANFSSILDMKTDDIKFPKLPVGTYVGVVKGLPEFGASSQKGTQYVRFQIELVDAGEDVEADDLEEFGNVAGTTLPITFYYADASGQALEFGTTRLRKFVEDCGVEGATNLRQGIDQCPGQTVLVKVKHSMNQDSGITRAELDGSAKYGE